MTAPIHDRKFEPLVSQVIAAEAPAIIVDQANAKRWVLRLAGALLGVNGRHRVDARGRCRLCRPAHLRVRRWRPWSARSTCTVRPALAHYLREAEPLMFPAEGRGVS